VGRLGYPSQLYFRFVNLIIFRWKAETTGGLIFGIIFSFIVSFFSVSFSFVKDRFFSGSKLKVTIAFAINYFIKLLIMFLIMSMSAWVCGAIIFGMTFGQLTF
jgi:hypothetical protein